MNRPAVEGRKLSFANAPTGDRAEGAPLGTRNKGALGFGETGVPEGLNPELPGRQLFNQAALAIVLFQSVVSFFIPLPVGGHVTRSFVTITSDVMVHFVSLPSVGRFAPISMTGSYSRQHGF